MTQRSDDAPSILWTRDQTAKAMGISVSTLKTLERQGVMKPLRLIHSVRYIRADVEATVRCLQDEQHGSAG